MQVKGTGHEVRMVKLGPNPTCTCRPVRPNCYHIAAVKRSVGMWTSPTKKKINLTQLRRNARPPKTKPGRKKQRRTDGYDVNAAPDADGKVESDAATDSDLGGKINGTCKQEGGTSPMTKKNIRSTQMPHNATNNKKAQSCKQQRGNKSSDDKSAPDADGEINVATDDEVGGSVNAACNEDNDCHHNEFHKLQDVFVSDAQYDQADLDIARMDAETRLTIGNCKLTLKDLETLDKNNWLNDTVMHAYLGLLALGLRAGKENFIYVFPSFLAHRWDSCNYTGWLYTKTILSSYTWLLMPLNLHGNHWALLVANVSKGTVGIADSLPSPQTTVCLSQFKDYMVARAQVTQELGTWADTAYDLRFQTDGDSCGVLALMAAEAVTSCISERNIDPRQAQRYRKYIRARLVMQSQVQQLEDYLCSMPFCSRPSGERHKISWVQCDQCDRWCHNVCVGKREGYKVGKDARFLCHYCAV